MNRLVTNAMNEWGFIGEDIYVGIGKSATSNKFKSRRGYVRDERLVLSNPHSSLLGVTSNFLNRTQYNLITEYERDLTEKDKKALSKEIAFAESLLPRTQKFVFLKFLGLILFALTIYAYPKTWIIVILSIISFFMIWMLILETRDLIKVPTFLSAKCSVIDTGIAQVKEFKIDRYIKIKSYGDEGDHFILEYKGRLTMVGGQDFDGIRKLKNKIEYIDIMDSGKKYYYHTRVDKSGNTLEPFLELKGKLPDELTKSELWKNLTEQVPLAGKLEELRAYIHEQP